MSEEERAAARQAMDDRRGGRSRERRASRFDTDGDGVISDEERAAAYEQRKLEREIAMEKYDADGDGRLSRSERESARTDGARVGRPGGGRSGHGGFGRGGGFGHGGGRGGYGGSGQGGGFGRPGGGQR